ncbi:Heart and RRM expressed sequence [Intoshia linei]|uniref:Heart and RRM expressed sequence n=1 Tax=Intoshia linei TaxID=1819745 RepID=A0A177B7K8_9BILA|nr:Heart and RRM expressed sequence [Intoshia linei]
MSHHISHKIFSSPIKNIETSELSPFTKLNKFTRQKDMTQEIDNDTNFSGHALQSETNSNLDEECRMNIEKAGDEISKEIEDMKSKIPKNGSSLVEYREEDTVDPRHLSTTCSVSTTCATKGSIEHDSVIQDDYMNKDGDMEDFNKAKESPDDLIDNEEIKDSQQFEIKGCVFTNQKVEFEPLNEERSVDDQIEADKTLQSEDVSESEKMETEQDEDVSEKINENACTNNVTENATTNNKDENQNTSTNNEVNEDSSPKKENEDSDDNSNYQTEDDKIQAKTSVPMEIDELSNDDVESTDNEVTAADVKKTTKLVNKKKPVAKRKGKEKKTVSFVEVESSEDVSVSVPLFDQPLILESKVKRSRRSAEMYVNTSVVNKSENTKTDTIIATGKGIKLSSISKVKDAIKNASYADVSALHCILFSHRCKLPETRSNLLSFNGLDQDNADKCMTILNGLSCSKKIKTFAQILDINLMKLKKADIVDNVYNFLLKPRKSDSTRSTRSRVNRKSSVESDESEEEVVESEEEVVEKSQRKKRGRKPKKVSTPPPKKRKVEASSSEVKSKNYKNPTMKNLKASIQNIIKTTDLNKTTMKTVYGMIEKEYPGIDINDSKGVIKKLVNQVRTLFVSGLPMDTRPRELYLLFRSYPGYEYALLKAHSTKQDRVVSPVAFIKFKNRQFAVKAKTDLANFLFDPNLNQVIRLEFARSNTKSSSGSKMFAYMSNSDAKSLSNSVMQKSNSVYGYNCNAVMNMYGGNFPFTYPQMATNNGYPPFPVPTSYLYPSIYSSMDMAQISLNNNEVESSILFVSNISLFTTGPELVEIFSTFAEFEKIRITCFNFMSVAFAYFISLNEASEALEGLQGYVPFTSDRGGIVIHYANPKMIDIMEMSNNYIQFNKNSID